MDGILELLKHTDADHRRQGAALLASLSPAEAGAILSRLKGWDRLLLDGLCLEGVRPPMRLADFLLRGGDLSGASLRNRTIQDVHLHGTRLVGVRLERAQVVNLAACNVDLTGVDLSQLVGRRVVLDGARLTDARAAGVRLEDASMVRADLQRLQAPSLYAPGLDLRGTNLRGADLRGAVLTGADLRDTDLRDANLSGADLRYADLRDALLVDCALAGAQLTDALMDEPAAGALWIGPEAELRGRILAGQDLGGADLRGADLRDTDLRGAVLEGARLEGADLRGAACWQSTRGATQHEWDWTGRDLRGAEVSATELAACFSLRFWVDERTRGTTQATLAARGGVRVPSWWRMPRLARWERAVWWREAAPLPEELSEAVPLLPGMWVWEEAADGGWVRRVQGEGRAGGQVVVTAPPQQLSRRLADLRHLETYEAALLWLVLSLGLPGVVAWEEPRLFFSRGQWRLSTGPFSNWEAVLPLELPDDAHPARVLAAAWTWFASSKVQNELMAMMTMTANPSPPAYHRRPDTPAQLSQQHRELRVDRADQEATQRRRAILERWSQQHAPLP